MKKRWLLILLALALLLPLVAFAGSVPGRLPGDLIPLNPCASGHEYMPTTKVASTCTSAGMLEMKCTRCGHVGESRRTAPLGHDMQWTGAWSPAPDCDTDGYKLFKCNRCEHTETTFGEAASGHSGYTMREEPTCTQNGKVYVDCDQCGKTVVLETLPAIGHHTWVLHNINRDDVECIAGGTAYYHCSVCRDQKNESVPPTGHQWQPVFATAATCTSPKVVTYECSKCSDQKTETEGTAIAHSWKDNNIIKPATCTEDGKASSVCQMCGKTENARIIPKLGHNWGTAKVLVAPTCSSAGKSESTCQTCGEKKTENMKKLAHHWGEWKVIKEATQTETGTKERICKNCGVRDTETIPKKGAKPAPTKKPSSVSSSSAVLEAGYGTVEVFTTSGKVNIRSGPSKDNKRVIQVDKRNTCLGELLEAKADKKGVVWFKVKYKGKTGWITSDYARAVVGELDGRTRRIEGKETELTNLYLRSTDEAVETLALEEDYRYNEYETEASNEAVFLSGNDYVQTIELTGEGYTVYGVKIGDKIKDAQKKFKKANLVLDYDSADEHVYNIICSQDSLFIDERGFDGTLTVVVSDGKVESMRLEASSPAEE